MTTLSETTAQFILERMGVPGLQKVYVLGSFANPVTFASQQMRAFNLIWALFTAGVLTPEDRVAVIGGGLAGITAAAAAALKQCKVTIIEKASQPLYLQRGNFTRYVHPNILNWPEPNSDVADTAFPILNWHAARVDDVVSQIEEQWDLFSSKITKRFGYEVDAITPVGALTSVKANRIYGTGPTLLDEEFKCVIIAVGFGLEKSVSNVRFRSYWDNDGLHRELEPTHKVKRFLISGCGDGGLIDALRLRISNFKHEHLVSEFFSSDDMNEVRECLRDIEEEFRPSADDHNTSQKLYRAYKERLRIPPSLEERIRSRLRLDTHVTLNSPDSTPLSLRSSILNRFAAFLLTEYGDLHYAQGTVEIKLRDDEYLVTFSRDGGFNHVQNYDEVIVRHGPNSAVTRLLPENATELLRKLWKTFKDPATQRLWNDEFFPKSTSEAVISSAKAIDLAAQQFSGAFPLLYYPEHIRAVAVANFGGVGGYVVTLKKGTEMPHSMRRRFVAGIPVTYVEEVDSVSPVSVLEMGSEIYNFDLVQRAGTDMQIVGTLGCFVKLSTGEVAILSNNSVLVGEDLGIAGDRIARLTHDKTGSADIIAKLRSFEAIAGAQDNYIDAAIAVLDQGVSYSATFAKQFDLPAISGIGQASLKQKVFKVGRTTGLTYGTVTGIDEDVRVQYGTKARNFRGLLSIESNAGELFFVPGDGGAVVVSLEGKVLGLGFASGGGITFVCPIQRILEHFNCEILLPTK